MDGIEGAVYLALIVCVFCLAGALLAGPLAVVGTLVGGRMRGVGFVSALTALFVGAVGLLLAAAAYFFLGAMFEGVIAAMLLLPPLASLTLGGVALWLRRRRRAEPTD
ncbi:MAG: hypothetical protein JOZ02_03160 [Acidobacteria bacterium]|nr:hypothetical protein [Acidobacteriota bacterium]